MANNLTNATEHGHVDEDENFQSVREAKQEHAYGYGEQQQNDHTHENARAHDVEDPKSADDHGHGHGCGHGHSHGHGHGHGHRQHKHAHDESHGERGSHHHTKAPESTHNHGHGHGCGHAHGNEHGHGCSHGHGDCNGSKSDAKKSKKMKRKAMCRLVSALIFCLIFLGCETAGGILSNSIAVLSDAVHLLGDVASFLVSICALRVGTTSSTARFTFGLARAEVLGALTSTLITLALTVVLAYEAVVRLLAICTYEIALLENNTTNATVNRDFEPVNGMIMTCIAGAGIFVNLVLLLILTGSGHQHSHGGLPASHGHDHGHGHGGCKSSEKKKSKKQKNSRGDKLEVPLLEPVQEDLDCHVDSAEDLNVRAACVHAVGDLLQSIAVLLSGGSIWLGQHFHWTGWIQILDPGCTLIFALLVIATTIPIFKSIVIVLMEGTPQNLDANNIFSTLKEHLRQPKDGGVRGIHDLHIWTLNGTEHCLSVHIVTAPEQEGGNMHLAMSTTRRLLREKFGIIHSTVQVEQGGQKIDPSGCLEHEWQ